MLVSKQNGNGKVVEWFMATVLKTVDVQASVGSNPTLSATGHSSAVECWFWEPEVAGSIPAAPIYTYK
jgi:hypothetical protein